MKLIEKFKETYGDIIKENVFYQAVIAFILVCTVILVVSVILALFSMRKEQKPIEMDFEKEATIVEKDKNVNAKVVDINEIHKKYPGVTNWLKLNGKGFAVMAGEQYVDKDITGIKSESGAMFKGYDDLTFADTVYANKTHGFGKVYKNRLIQYYSDTVNEYDYVGKIEVKDLKAMADKINKSFETDEPLTFTDVIKADYGFDKNYNFKGSPFVVCETKGNKTDVTKPQTMYIYDLVKSNKIEKK